MYSNLCSSSMTYAFKNCRLIKGKEKITYPQVILFASRSIHICKTIFMHDPVGFDSSRGFASIENKCFLNTQWFGLSNGLVSSGCLPISGSCRPVWPWTVWIFSIPWGKEVPLLFSIKSHFCKRSTRTKKNQNHPNYISRSSI